MDEMAEPAAISVVELAAAAAHLADGALESEGVPSGEVARLRTVLAAAAAAPAAAEIVEEAAAQVVVAASEVAEKEMSSADDSAPPQNFFQSKWK